MLINMTGQRRNRGELLTDAKHISLFRSVPFSDPSAKLSFPLLPFSRVTSKTKSCWQISAGVQPGNFLGQLNTLTSPLVG